MASDARESVAVHRPLHAAVLPRLVAGNPGLTTADLQLCYDAIAPLVYRGTTTSPVDRRWRREQLEALVKDDRVAYRDTPRGRVWVPIELPEGLEVRHATRAARATND